jgi:dihydroneopterin aldolase
MAERSPALDEQGRPLDQVALRGLRVRGRLGVLAAEKSLGQWFVIDVVLHLDTRSAAAGDDLSATVDYGTLAQQVSDVVSGDPVDLIETLAQLIADVALGAEAVQAVDVAVHKPQAPVTVPFEDVVVSVRRWRS